jgi:predicted O-methyltransferase YrrM
MRKNIIGKGLHLLNSKFDMVRLGKANKEEGIIHQIINEIKQADWTDEEEKAFEKIEALRVFYSKNSNEIFIKDFGSGSSSDSRTVEQMKQGKVKTTTVSQVYQSASSSKKEGAFMFKIIRAYKLKKCFELGTCLGMSTAYGTEALRLNEGNNTYITFEGAPELAKLAESSLKEFSFSNFTIVKGKFEDTLNQYIAENNDIDFAFIDGHHDEKATIKYFELFYQNLSQKAILIFDDINWSRGMQKAWRMIKKDKRIAWTISNYFRGICYIDKENERKKRNYKIWF